MSDESIKPDSYSVKTTTDITERIQDMTKKTGLSHKDLFNAMVTRYYKELETGSELDQSVDMQHIRYHLNRIESIFLGSQQKIMDLKQDYLTRKEQDSAKAKEKLEYLQQQILKHSLDTEKQLQTKVELETALQKLKKRNNELEESHTANRMTIDLLQEKNKELAMKLQESSTAAEDLARAREEYRSLHQECLSYQGELGTAQHLVSQLETQIAQAEKETTEKMTALKEDYEKTIQQIKAIHLVETDKNRIQAEKTLLEKFQEKSDQQQSKLEQVLEKNESLLKRNQELAEKAYGLQLKLQELTSNQVSQLSHE